MWCDNIYLYLHVYQYDKIWYIILSCDIMWLYCNIIYWYNAMWYDMWGDIIEHTIMHYIDMIWRDTYTVNE